MEQNEKLSRQQMAVNAVNGYIEKTYREMIEFSELRSIRNEELLKKVAKSGQYEQLKEKEKLKFKEEEFLRVRRTRLTRNHFKCLKVIGRGTFGEVKLVQMKSGGIFALKILQKDEIIQKNQINYVRTERDILSDLDTPWVVRMFFSFQDTDFLYLVMEYCPGGDLMGLLIRQNILSECQAAFYLAEIAIAIDFIHSLGIIHRDVKPDNLLLDREGHIKLGDFGLSSRAKITRSTKEYAEKSKSINSQSEETDQTGAEKMNTKTLSETWRKNQRKLAFSLVGTPFYMAPEVLNNSEGYTKECDWWSVGIILYEMIIGYAPFYDNDPQISLRKLSNWKTYFDFPLESMITQEAKSLIRAFISDQEFRLKDFEEIKKREFLKRINFETIRSQKPPFPIDIKYIDDTTYFDDFSNEKIPWACETSNNHAQRTPSAVERDWMFLNFTYKRFDSMV